jgi:hypothetical protein
LFLHSGIGSQLATFAHAASGRTNVIRHWGALSVPAALAADIEFVSGLGVFVAQPTRKTARAGTVPPALVGQEDECNHNFTRR